MPEFDRREFLKIVGLSAGAAATAACQEPVELVIPYLNQPEELVPGVPTYYASTCRECPSACGTVVKTREGRPIKVDGNPDDPISKGRLCVRGQASLYRTYDAARFKGPMKRSDGGALVEIGWDEVLDLLVEKLRPAAEANRVYFLGGLETGTLDGLIDQTLAAIGSPNRVSFEPFAQEALRSANERVFGVDALPHFAFEEADVVVSFGTDFLETWLNPLQNQVGFAASRRAGNGYAVHVGPRLSLSGANADLWLSPAAGTEILVALALAGAVARRRGVDLGPLGPGLAGTTPASTAERTGIPAEKLERLAQRIAKASSPLALPAGRELEGANAAEFAAAVQLLNFVSGAIGKTVTFGPDHALSRVARFRDMKELAGKMIGGQVGVLLVHGANPVYAAPQVGFADAMRTAGLLSVSFSSAADETTALADLVLPDHTPFEAWGDAEPVRGVRRLQQPTVRPLMNTRALGDTLLELGRRLGHAARLPSGSFKDLLQARWGSVGFDAALARGGDFKPTAPRSVSLSPSATSLEFNPATIEGQGDLTLLVYPSLHLYDGRSARIAMLQEIPDPVTKLVWGSYAELHPESAAQLGIEEGDVVRVSTEAGAIELPAFPHEAVRPGYIAVMAGQGHQPVDPDFPRDRVDRHWRRASVGVNALEILPGRLDAASGGLAWLSTRAKVEPTGTRALMPKTQPTFDQEGRGIAQVAGVAALHGGKADSHAEPAYADASHLEAVDFDPSDDGRHPDYRWGMAIDLDACSGCNACLTACSQENNIPAIGEELVRQGREMHWIRLERYIEREGDEIEVRHTPMLCQHCGAAPCEAVCPTLATYHSAEGLNVMVPNRCIGTRYCGNNCSYKVRRFNYYPYDLDVREPEHLALNPDVTVRSKGVMEKCSFCVQRINAAKDQVRIEQGEDATVADGVITPACAQTCPSSAITFGNHKDPGSQVSKRRADARAYWVFPHLNTRPAVTYLKSVKRAEDHEV